jgi:hypothetical protein
MSKDLSCEMLDDGLKGYVSLTEKIVFVSADNERESLDRYTVKPVLRGHLWDKVVS